MGLLLISSEAQNPKMSGFKLYELERVKRTFDIFYHRERWQIWGYHAMCPGWTSHCTWHSLQRSGVSRSPTEPRPAVVVTCNKVQRGECHQSYSVAGALQRLGVSRSPTEHPCLCLTWACNLGMWERTRTYWLPPKDLHLLIFNIHTVVNGPLLDH